MIGGPSAQADSGAGWSARCSMDSVHRCHRRGPARDKPVGCIPHHILHGHGHGSTALDLCDEKHCCLSESAAARTASVIGQSQIPTPPRHWMTNASTAPHQSLANLPRQDIVVECKHNIDPASPGRQWWLWGLCCAFFPASRCVFSVEGTPRGCGRHRRGWAARLTRRHLAAPLSTPSTCQLALTVHNPSFQ